MRANSKFIIILVFILFLAGLLRFFNLGNRPLYQDEPMHTVYIAAQPLSFIITTNYGSNLYPLILHFILPLGNTEFTARLPAALFGLLCVLGIFLVGKQMFGKKVALLAALALSVSTHAIYFSQQARGYSGLMLFSLLSLFFFLKALEKKNHAYWMLYIIFSVINIYNHFFALILLPVHAGFVVVLIIEKWGSKKTEHSGIQSKEIALFSACTLLIVAIIFLLYLPTAGHSTGSMFTQSARNIFQLRTDLNFPIVVNETLKRQFDYYTSRSLFFIKGLFFFLGILACLKKQKKELSLCLLYLVVPFSIFFLLNPPIPGYLPGDNKFIFLVPVILLLAAKGMIGFFSFLGKLVFQFARIHKIPSLINNLAFALLMVILLAGESILIKDYYFHFWRIRSLERSREVNRYLENNVDSTDIIIFPNLLNKSDILLVIPFNLPSDTRKRIMVVESGFFFLQDQLKGRSGLWLIVDRRLLADESFSTLRQLSDKTETVHLSQNSILHFRGTEKTVIEKIEQGLTLLLHQPLPSDLKNEISLLLTKFYLISNEYEKSLESLESKEILTESISHSVRDQKPNKVIYRFADMLFGLKQSDYHLYVKKNLEEEISQLLYVMSEMHSQEKDYDQAILFQKKAIELTPGNLDIRLSLVESLIKKGMDEEAKAELKKALKLSTTPQQQVKIIQRLRNLCSLTTGYIIWRTEKHWQVRWWSNQNKTLSGKIQSTKPIRIVKAYDLVKNKDYKHQKTSLIFKKSVKKGMLQGFDIQTSAGDKLTFDLRIDSRKKISKNIITITDNDYPDILPFSLK